MFRRFNLDLLTATQFGVSSRWGQGGCGLFRYGGLGYIWEFLNIRGPTIDLKTSGAPIIRPDKAMSGLEFRDLASQAVEP